jgi:hypothetical protein
MSGIQGQPHNIHVTFRADGSLYDPFFIANVDIYDVAVGGVPIASLTPSNVSLGLWRATWNIPISQTPKTYYDQWTWRAASGLTLKVQRYKFDVQQNPITVPTSSSCPKLPNARSAIGYWGRNISKRIDCEQIPQKIRVLLQDKLLSRGKDIFFWQQIISSDVLALTCSCVKDTTNKADITCNSCYGTSFIPGYVKFFHENIYVSSISSGLTLTNIILDKNIKPYRLLLDANQLTGTIESGAIPYVNSLNLDWDYKSDITLIKNTNTILVEFSTDNISYFPIAEINDVGKQPIGVGNIYLRTTLTRANVNDRSPEYEILRLRHPTKLEPYIKILRPQISEVPSLMQYGSRVENVGERFWTSPLDFFDSTIVQDTPAAKIIENSFYERVTGINTGVRFVTTKLNYNEEFGIFSHQSFESRKVQPEEIYAKFIF